jgi:hypothetical protein
MVMVVMMMMMMRVRWVGVIRRAQGQINAVPRCPLPCNVVGSQRCSCAFHQTQTARARGGTLSSKVAGGGCSLARNINCQMRG